MNNVGKIILSVSALSLALNTAFCQTATVKPPVGQVTAGIPVNYEEDKVGDYKLPDVLTTQSGKKISTQADWLNKRRPELVKLFEENQYGTVPPKPTDQHFSVFDKGTPVFNGGAVRKQVTIYFTKDTAKHKVDLLCYLPANANKAVPLMLMISFSPNSTLSGDDPGVKAGFMWTKAGERLPAPKAGIGRLSKEQIEKFTSAGIGVAAVYYGDIEPDYKKGYQNGIRGYYLKPGQDVPGTHEWGAISAWSWGLSRVMDYLETDKQIDAKRVALQGVSRLGKTVLWTGARDNRFKVVLASCSGEGGAAISRRNYGENIGHMSDTSRYYYQFAPQWHEYAKDFNKNPVDAHELVALMAPRYLLLQTGDVDFWSDPKGEFLAAQSAQPVYQLFGKEGPAPNAPWPAAGDTSLTFNPLGYYMHAGGHGTVPSDWDVYLKYLQKFL